MSRLYFVKGKHSQERSVAREKELPNLVDIIRERVSRQPKVPQTTEEILLKQRLAEKFKPPSVKMAEAEERRRVAQEKIDKQTLREAQMAELAKAPSKLDELIAKLGVPSNPPTYELTEAEEKRELTPREKTLTERLLRASDNKQNHFSRNLNLLFNTPKKRSETGIKLVETLSGDDLQNALDMAEADRRPIDATFISEIRRIIMQKKSVPI